MNDWTQVVSMTLSAVVALTTAYIGYLIARLNHQARVAAVKVEEVKDDLRGTRNETQHRLKTLTEVASATHVLVNSAMTIQLRLNAELSRWKADQTHDPDHAAAAAAAETLYKEHEAKHRLRR